MYAFFIFSWRNQNIHFKMQNEETGKINVEMSVIPKEMLLAAGDRVSLRGLIEASVSSLADLGNRVAVVEYRGHDEEDDLRAKGSRCLACAFLNSRLYFLEPIVARKVDSLEPLRYAKIVFRLCKVPQRGP